MDKPDEALLWARESAYLRCLEYYDGDEAEVRAQMESKDAYDVAGWLAEAYRAGAAASAERIKELEARVAELEGALKPLSECEIPEESDSLPDGYGCRYYVTFGEIRTARALLKETDQ